MMPNYAAKKKENLYRVDENAINNVLPPTSGLMKNALNDVCRQHCSVLLVSLRENTT